MIKKQERKKIEVSVCIQELKSNKIGV